MRFLCLQDLWEKAKAAGNEGDADAASRLAHMCAPLRLAMCSRMMMQAPLTFNDVRYVRVGRAQQHKQQV